MKKFAYTTRVSARSVGGWNFTKCKLFLNIKLCNQCKYVLVDFSQYPDREFKVANSRLL